MVHWGGGGGAPYELSQPSNSFYTPKNPNRNLKSARSSKHLDTAREREGERKRKRKREREKERKREREKERERRGRGKTAAGAS